MAAQQQRVIAQQRRMMQQQQAQQAQQAQQQQQNQAGGGGGGGPQQPPPASATAAAAAGGPPHSQQPTPQQQPQQLPPGGPQTPPTMGSPNPNAIPGGGSPEGGDTKKNIAVALYQRRQVNHAMQQQQKAQQQAQFVHPPPQKRQRTNNNGDETPATTPQQMQPSPQLQHKMSPHVMNAQQQPNPNESPVMAMQQRLAAQQRSQFEQQQQMNSPQLARNSTLGTPQQQQQQLHQQQQQQRMSWNPDMDSPMNDMQSPANNMNNPGGMAAAANAAAAAAAANAAAAQNNSTNAMNNSSVLSFDLERFMMGDSGDFGEMFAAGDENPDQNLLMGGDGADLDPFGGGFLASMGGGLDLDSGMVSGNSSGGGGSGGAPSSHAISMNANTALQPYADLAGHTNKVSTAAFSIDGQWLASAGHDRKVMIWSVQDKKTLYTLDGHTGNITCARWSADARNLVATTSYDKTLRIWDVGSALASGAAKENKEDDDSKADNAAVSPKQLAKWDCRAQVTAVDFAPDRPDTICSLDAEGELKVWNLKTSNCEKSLKMASGCAFAACTDHRRANSHFPL